MAEKLTVYPVPVMPKVNGKPVPCRALPSEQFCWGGVEYFANGSARTNTTQFWFTCRDHAAQYCQGSGFEAYSIARWRKKGQHVSD